VGLPFCPVHAAEGEAPAARSRGLDVDAPRQELVLSGAGQLVGEARASTGLDQPTASDHLVKQLHAEYAAKVKANTTESYFMTELVDHLPASDKVPSPDKIIGYEVGAPGHLTYSKDLYRYYHELEKATPRVRVFSAPEKSEEGKEQLLIAVGDEAALAKLDRYKDITAKLADPRKITDAEAELRMLLGAADRHHGAVVALEIGLDLHPVHVRDLHGARPRLMAILR